MFLVADISESVQLGIATNVVTITYAALKAQASEAATRIEEPT